MMLRQSTLFLFSAAFLSKCNGFTANSAATGNHQSTLKLSSTGSDYEELLLGQTSDRRTFFKVASSLTAASAILPNIASAEVPVARTALQTAASLTLPPMGLGEFLLSSPA
jgi:hypothetical protein